MLEVIEGLTQGRGLDSESTTESKDKMEGRFLLDVVVGEGSSVLELLASKDQPLLVWGDALLILKSNYEIRIICK